MLEKNEILETYRVGLPPEQWADKPVEAVKIFDHSPKFLTYQGGVNKGKGQVKIADSGTYEILTQAEDNRKLEFTGKILKGKFELLQVEGEKLQLRKAQH